MEKAHDQNGESRGTKARHRLLSIFKESWRDDYKFFSARDLELCVKGLCGGIYEMAELELEADTIQALSGGEAGIVMRLHMGQEEGRRVLEKTLAPDEACFWLTQVSTGGLPEEWGGWKDVTDAAEA